MSENKRYRVFKYIDCGRYGVSDDIAEYTLATFDNHIEAEGLCDRLNEQEEQVKELSEENEELKDILKDITIQLDANHTMNTYQMVIPINKVIYNELNRRLKETSFNEELRRFLDD